MNAQTNNLFPLAERFVSLNGEGTHAGQRAAFIRFAGCNLNCSWCDTKWALSTDAATEFLSAQELAGWVKQQNVPCVTLTGGEPLLQSGLCELIDLLARDRSQADYTGRSSCLPSSTQSNHLFIEIETNGSVDLCTLAPIRNNVHITMDWKLPSSNMDHAMLASNIRLLTQKDALKFVVGSQEDLVAMAELLRSFNQSEHFDACVFVSPVTSLISPENVAAFIVENELNDVRMQLQLHKIIWPNQDRGV